jgi:hypothetical protein
MCTLITSKGTDIDENIANQNHATCTRTPKPGYLNLSIYGSFRPPFIHRYFSCKITMGQILQKKSFLTQTDFFFHTVT